MTIMDFFRIVTKNWWVMSMSALIMATLAFLGTRGEKPVYSSHSIINTGLVSGYNLESRGARIDYAYTNNEMENIITMARSYQMTEDLGVRLLAEIVMLDAPDYQIIGELPYRELRAALGDTIWAELRHASLEDTERAINRYRSSDDDNRVKGLLNGNDPYFGLDKLKTITINREGSSDLIRISYSSNDPGLTRFTIECISELLISKRRALKQRQSADVVGFFEQATRESSDKLRGSEDKLLGFMVENRIINYYEQTRYISSAKVDLDDLYQKEQLLRVSADSIIQRLAREMRGRDKLLDSNRDIIALREALSENSRAIARLETGREQAEDPGKSDAELLQLKLKNQELRDALAEKVKAVWEANFSPQGIPARELLAEWLSAVVRLEESSARMEVIRQQQADFMKIYDQFAPWGSTISRIEREIDVNERAYLENLHSYNQAVLHQISALMSANLTIVDKPYFPLKPAASKAIILVVVAFLAGAIIPLAVFIALFLLDQTMRTVPRAEAKTQLQLATAVPFIAKPDSLKRTFVDYRAIHNKSFEQMAHVLLIDTRRSEKVKPIIGFFSTRPEEGKTWLIERFTKFMIEKGNYMYYFTATEWEELAGREKVMYEGEKGFILIESPALLDKSGAHHVFDDVDLAILVCNANKVWNNADTRALKRLRDSVRRPIRLVLNGIPVDQMEEIIGEVPKRRHFFRRIMKRLVSRQFTLRKR